MCLYNSSFANYLSLVMIKHLELSFLKHKRVTADKQTWFRLTEHIIDSDVTLFKYLSFTWVTYYLRARGVTVSGYNKHTLQSLLNSSIYLSTQISVEIQCIMTYNRNLRKQDCQMKILWILMGIHKIFRIFLISDS